MGEVKLFRAYCYFYLVNLYGVFEGPYNGLYIKHIPWSLASK